MLNCIEIEKTQDWNRTSQCFEFDRTLQHGRATRVLSSVTNDSKVAKVALNRLDLSTEQKNNSPVDGTGSGGFPELSKAVKNAPLMTVNVNFCKIDS